MKQYLIILLAALFIQGCKKPIINHQPDVPARYSITIGIQPTDRPLTDAELEEVFQFMTKQAEDGGIAYQSILKDPKQRQITFNVIGMLLETAGKNPGLHYFSEALSRTANFEFWDVYQTGDEKAKTFFLKLYEQYELGTRMDIRLSDRNPEYISPVMAYVKSENMSFLDSIFKLPEVIKLLPPDMVLAWSRDPSKMPEQGITFELYGLKKTALSGPFLTGKDVMSINGTMEKKSKTVSIDLAFKPKPALKWAEKTRAAAGDDNRAIGILIDGKVISAPRVISEITNGHCLITGDFNIEESSKMINQLKLGALPCELKIVAAKKL